jgi:hypothetical protein
MEEPNERERVILRSPTFAKFYATNALVRGTDVDFRIDLFNEKIPTGKDETAYVSEALAILTPEAARILFQTLQRELERFEEAYGPIGISEARSRLHAEGPEPAERA